MQPWQQWWTMAQESAEAAKLAENAGLYRSAVSRYYYAAYQAATAVLLYLRLRTPHNREAWSHDTTPELLREHLSPVASSKIRFDQARRLAGLYTLRVAADYKVSHLVLSNATANQAGKDARYILDTIKSILP